MIYVKTIIIKTSEQKRVYFDYVVPCLANRGRRVSITGYHINRNIMPSGNIFCVIKKLLFLVQKRTDWIHVFSKDTFNWS